MAWLGIKLTKITASDVGVHHYGWWNIFWWLKVPFLLSFFPVDGVQVLMTRSTCFDDEEHKFWWQGAHDLMMWSTTLDGGKPPVELEVNVVPGCILVPWDYVNLQLCRRTITRLTDCWFHWSSITEVRIWNKTEQMQKYDTKKPNSILKRRIFKMLFSFFADMQRKWTHSSVSWQAGNRI